MTTRYDEQHFAALLREHPRFIRPHSVRGPRLTFRNATPDDAEFILSLRLDPTKNAHLSATPPDVEKQRQWLASMGDDQLYFIIEHEGPVGTVRLYDQRGTSFSWGSWILSNDAPQSAAVESMLMVYQVGLDLGFCASHYEVRTGNAKVWQFHERCGASRTHEDAENYYYSIGKGEILDLFKRYAKRLDPPVSVEW